MKAVAVFRAPECACFILTTGERERPIVFGSAFLYALYTLSWGRTGNIFILHSPPRKKGATTKEETPRRDAGFVLRMLCVANPTFSLSV
jgi:hypothetical protein